MIPSSAEGEYGLPTVYMYSSREAHQFIHKHTDYIQIFVSVSMLIAYRSLPIRIHFFTAGKIFYSLSTCFLYPVILLTHTMTLTFMHVWAFSTNENELSLLATQIMTTMSPKTHLK